VQNQEAILRNYNISVKLFDRNGTEMTTFARQRTGQVAASATATETFTIDIRQSWAAMQGGTYQATCTVTDSLKFKRESTDSGTLTDGLPK
jgi:predicted secreted protein